MSISTAHLIVTVLCMSFIHLILFPLCIYHTVRITYVRSAIIMQKRNITASIIASYFAIGWICINFPIAHYMFLFPSSSLTRYALDHIMQLSYPFLSQGLVYCILYRFWMIYFTFCYSVSISNEKWKLHINSNGCNKQEQWIINHRKTYGRSGWISKRIFCIYFISATLSSIFFALGLNNLLGFNDKLAQTIDSVFYLIPLIAIFTLWIKTPKFADNFFCRYEMKAIIIVYSITLGMNLSVVILLNVDHALEGTYWETVAWTAVIAFACYGALFCQTELILIKIKNNCNYYGNILSNAPELTVSYTSNTSSNPVELENIPKTPSVGQTGKIKKRNIKLIDVLQSKELFITFMNHLVKELSTECLLSFIECSQFRELLETDILFMDKVNKVSDDIDNSIEIVTSPSFKHRKNRRDVYIKVKLPGVDTVPKSMIVYSDSNVLGIEHYKQIAEQLCGKYVDESASFCINIGYWSRGKVIGWVNKYCRNNSESFEDAQYEQMYNLFEPCRDEMYRLMQHNLDRFMKTNVFEQSVSKN
eukprot:199138_1